MFNKKILLVVLSAFARGIHAGQPFASMDELTSQNANYSRALEDPPLFDSVVYEGAVWGMTKDLYPGGNNYIYGADRVNHRVLKFDEQFKFLLSWGEEGTGDGQFELPKDAAVDQFHNVYVVDTKGGKLQKFDSDGNYLLTFSPPSPFNSPSVVKVDCDGDIWVGDRANSRIMKFKNDGTLISTHDLGYNLQDFEFDSDGNIHVINHNAAKMVKYDSNFNKLLDYTLGAWPNYIAVDCNGNLYVTEEGGEKVSIWTKDGQSSGTSSFGSQGNGNGQFQYAMGIFIDGSDAYVSDITNANIQKFNLNNVCSEGPGPFAMSCPISSQLSVPTSSPTSNPTSSPTVSPTVSPTSSPTGAPTVIPTGAPTTSPTGTPTSSPTGAPGPSSEASSTPSFTKAGENEWFIENTGESTEEATSSDTVVVSMPFNATNRDIGAAVFEEDCVTPFDKDGYFKVDTTGPTSTTSDGFVQFNTTLDTNITAINGTKYWNSFTDGSNGGWFRACVETYLSFTDNSNMGNGGVDQKVTFKNNVLNISVSLTATYEVDAVSVIREEASTEDVKTDYSVFIVAYECDVADPYAEATGKTYNQGDKITICVSDVSKDIVQVEEFVDLVITQDGINDYNFITGTLYNPDITTPVCLDATATQRRLCYASMRALARFFQSQSPTDLTISGSVNVIRDGRRVRRKLRMALPAAEMTNDETSLGVFGRRIEEEAEGRGKFEMNVSLTSGDDSAGFFGGEATGLVSMAIGSAGLALMA